MAAYFPVHGENALAELGMFRVTRPCIGRNWYERPNLVVQFKEM